MKLSCQRLYHTTCEVTPGPSPVSPDPLRGNFLPRTHPTDRGKKILMLFSRHEDSSERETISECLWAARTTSGRKKPHFPGTQGSPSQCPACRRRQSPRSLPHSRQLRPSVNPDELNFRRVRKRQRQGVKRVRITCLVVNLY